MQHSLPQNKKIILFDGVCNLCNSAVQFIMKNDKKDIFRFVALQSELGKEICEYIGIDQNKIDSIVLYNPGVAYYYKSSAVLEIGEDLGGIYSLASILKIFPVKRDVETGVTEEGKVQIVAGLIAGDSIISEGAFYLLNAK